MKPRSPLPWKRQLLPDGTFQYQDANMEPVMDDDCLPVADMPYVLHACNAYPKLVAALLSHSALIPDKETIALLKELGELMK